MRKSLLIIPFHERSGSIMCSRVRRARTVSMCAKWFPSESEGQATRSFIKPCSTSISLGAHGVRMP